MAQRIEVNVQTGERKTLDLTSEEEAAAKAIKDAFDAERAKTGYIKSRRSAYPDVGDQLDDLYKKGAFSDEMASKIKKVKDDNPKPE